ncbi:MAG: hypothetical protein K2K05_02015 [Muribaculaceae bacterium]|nr:hypothetical protein [Muribaculaceae bacterium]
MSGTLRQLLLAVSHLIAPRVCRVCGQSLNSEEEYLCLECFLDIPRTQSHKRDFNDIHRRLGHRCKVDRGAGWFFYRKDSAYARLLVDAKYHDMPGIDRYLGRMCATELDAEGFFAGINIMIPMPMHWRKRLLRGYNQAEAICEGIRDVTGLEFSKTLTAVRSHGVQSRHSRTQRYSKIAHTMEVKDPAAISGKHVLLVDDIITTGASCIEAIRALQEASPAAVSVLSLGLTMES